MFECNVCGDIKSPEFFSKKKNSKSGYSNKCKECHNTYVRTVWYPKNSDKQKSSSLKWKQTNRNRVLSTAYSVPLLEVDEVFERNDGSCEVCGSRDNLVFDHCHQTNKARGILCSSCNTLLGRLGDSYDSVKFMAERFLKYLNIAGSEATVGPHKPRTIGGASPSPATNFTLEG